jgi:hypothetical protein
MSKSGGGGAKKKEKKRKKELVYNHFAVSSSIFKTLGYQLANDPLLSFYLFASYMFTNSFCSLLFIIYFYCYYLHE